MFKYLTLIVALCCAGCQSTQHPHKAMSAQSAFLRSEKLSLRVEKYVTSYDVEVQRAVLTPGANGEKGEWKVVSAPRVWGYPGKWKTNESLITPVDQVSKASYFMNGEMVEVSLEPGVHLIAKVMPVMQNTARIIGVFSESKVTPNGMEMISVPFDITCPFGEYTVIYHEEIGLNSALMKSAK